MASLDADVVVVGSGAGGAPVAVALAEAGARVVVLEKGPYYTVRDFRHDEVAIALRDFWTPYPSDDPHTLARNDEARARPGREGWTSQCVGGATVHMSGFAFRLTERDFALATATGGVAEADLADWPIAYADLAPFYDLAEARLGVSGQAGVNPFEAPRGAYPLPPLRAHPMSRLVDEAGARLGLHPYPMARSILSRAYGSRPPCNLCGFCGDFGCENGAKSSTLATLIPAAEATGRCEIRAGCMARRILVDDADKVTGVEFVDAEGRTGFVRARVVCVAASAIESARLLLLSETGRHRHGLANGSGLVGKNLTFSALAKAMAFFDRAQVLEAVGAEGFDLPFLQRALQDDQWLPGAGLPCPKGGSYAFSLIPPNPVNAAVLLCKDADWKLWGPPLKERLKTYFHDEIAMEVEVFGEFLPWKGSRVDLDPAVKDRFGHPAARLHVKLHPATQATSKHMLERAMTYLKEMKPAPKRVVAWTWSAASWPLQHGTCRFGSDPSTSVLDRDCQAHEVKNLYVTDSSFMPTSGGAPASQTILANAFRVAHAIRRRFLAREI